MAERIDKKDKNSEKLTNQESNKSSSSKKKNSKPKKKTSVTKHQNNTSNKKFQHYFYEFIMLFLAVFCGFLADNWREQLQENNREEEFIHSIVEDLRSDTHQSAMVLKQLNAKSAGIDSVLNALSSSKVIDNSNNAYRLWTKNLDIKSFVSNDRTIQQLKNSGELRLIRKRAVSDGIMKYDQTVKSYYQQSDMMYSAISDQHIYKQLFDFISLSKNEETPVPLTEQGKAQLNEAYAHLQLWNAGLKGLISWLENINNEGKKLLNLIQTEYDIE